MRPVNLQDILNRSSTRGVQARMHRILFTLLALVAMVGVAFAAPKKSATDAMRDANARLRVILAKQP